MAATTKSKPQLTALVPTAGGKLNKSHERIHFSFGEPPLHTYTLNFCPYKNLHKPPKWGMLGIAQTSALSLCSDAAS